MRRTSVLSTKVYSDWDWHQIELLLHGPLGVASRLLRLMHSHPKWVKRQLSLLRPEKDCFSRLRLEDPKSFSFARALYKLLELLLSFDAGAEYASHRFISHMSNALQRYITAHEPQYAIGRSSMDEKSLDDSLAGTREDAKKGGMFSGVAEGLFSGGKLRRRTSHDNDFDQGEDSDDEVAPYAEHRNSVSRGGANANTGYSPDGFLSEHALATSMTREYFVILGMLSNSARGLQQMRKLRLWQTLSKLVQLEGRTDLVTLLINSLNYTQPPPGSQARSILESCISSPSNEYRLAATQHLAVLAAARFPSFAEWGMPLLCGLIEDEDRAVRQKALQVLLEATVERDCLGRLVALNVRPDLLVTDVPTELESPRRLTSTRGAVTPIASPPGGPQPSRRRRLLIAS